MSLQLAKLSRSLVRFSGSGARRANGRHARSRLLQIIKRLEEIGADFRSLTEAIDTTTPVGRMFTEVLGSFADYAKRGIMQSHNAKIVMWPCLSVM